MAKKLKVKKWWAYKHMDGTIYFVPYRKNSIVDIAGAEANPVILKVYGVYEAKTLAEAQRKLKEKLTI